MISELINPFCGLIILNIFSAGGDNAEVPVSDAATQADGVSEESPLSTVSTIC